MKRSASRGNLNSTKKHNSRVKAAVRVRPVFEHEYNDPEFINIVATGSSVVSVQLPNGVSRDYAFDHVFGPESTQEQIYSTIGSSVVADVLKGWNGTIIAYGQTGTGKTYTMGMLGAAEADPGLVPRCLQDVFQHVESNQKYDYVISMSILQLYNDSIQDLLHPHSGSLVLRENSERGVFVEGLVTETVNSYAESAQVIERALTNRTMAPTLMNTTSSRAHTVISVDIMRIHIDNTESASLSTTMRLVDLAGSERVRKTQSSGLRLEEAKNINQSLSALANVISALSNPVTSHIPFRDSKLTRILKDSLSGNSSTVLIATVTPASDCKTETLSTLAFASRCMSVQTSPVLTLEKPLWFSTPQPGVASTASIHLKQFEAFGLSTLKNVTKSASMNFQTPSQSGNNADAYDPLANVEQASNASSAYSGSVFESYKAIVEQLQDEVHFLRTQMYQRENTISQQYETIIQALISKKSASETNPQIDSYVPVPKQAVKDKEYKEDLDAVWRLMSSLYDSFWDVYQAATFEVDSISVRKKKQTLEWTQFELKHRQQNTEGTVLDMNVYDCSDPPFSSTLQRYPPDECATLTEFVDHLKSLRTSAVEKLSLLSSQLSNNEAVNLKIKKDLYRVANYADNLASQSSASLPMYNQPADTALTSTQLSVSTRQRAQSLEPQRLSHSSSDWYTRSSTVQTTQQQNTRGVQSLTQNEVQPIEKPKQVNDSQQPSTPWQTRLETPPPMTYASMLSENANPAAISDDEIVVPSHDDLRNTTDVSLGLDLEKRGNTFPSGSMYDTLNRERRTHIHNDSLVSIPNTEIMLNEANEQFMSGSRAESTTQAKTKPTVPRDVYYSIHTHKANSRNAVNASLVGKQELLKMEPPIEKTSKISKPIAGANSIIVRSVSVPKHRPSSTATHANSQQGDRFSQQQRSSSVSPLRRSLHLREAAQNQAPQSRYVPYAPKSSAAAQPPNQKSTATKSQQPEKPTSSLTVRNLRQHQQQPQSQQKSQQLRPVRPDYNFLVNRGRELELLGHDMGSDDDSDNDDFYSQLDEFERLSSASGH